MPATTLTRVYDTLLSLTLDAYREQLADQIHKSIPYLWWMEERGRGAGMRMENGGAKVRVPVVYQKNSNAKSYSKYDRIDLVPTEEITSAFEDWSESAVSIALSRRELRQNSGRAAILNLLREKVNVAEMSFREEIERQLVQGVVDTGDTSELTAGNSGKDMIPLGKLLSRDTDVTVHSVASGTDTWWRTNGGAGALLATNTNKLTLQSGMIKAYNDCSKGSTNDFPDLILTTEANFRGYEMSLVAQQRYGNYSDDGAASVGFESLKFKGAVIMWSEVCPSFGTGATTDALLVPASDNSADHVMFFINSRWIETVVDQESHFVSTPFEEPVDQTAIYSKILFMGQHIVTQRRKQGVLYGMDPDSWTA